MLLSLLRNHLGKPFAAARHARVLSAYRRAHEILRAQALPLTSANAQLELCCTLAGQPANVVRNCIATYFEEAPLPLLHRFIRPGLVTLLKAAKERGILLAVFSDYPAERKLQAMGLRQYFDVVACAQDADVLRLKPDPAGANYILERLNVPPSKAIYIGDRQEVDAECATRAGMRAVIIGRRHRNEHSGVRFIRHFGELQEELELHSDTSTWASAR
jgi:HAD superfamily hydrolase (TIGR01509 family)